MTVVMLSSVLQSGYSGDDTMNSLNPTVAKFNGVSLSSFTFADFKYWFAEQGRFYPGAFYANYIWKIFDRVIYYKIFVLFTVCLNIILFYELLGLLGFSWAASVLFCLSALGLLQLRLYHDAVLSFACLLLVLTAYLFSSLILFIKYLDSRKISFLVVSLFLFLCALLTYEVSYLFCLIFASIAAVKLRGLKPVVKTAFPYFILTGIAVLFSLYLRSKAVEINERYIVSNNSLDVLKAYFFQLAAGLPMSYYFINPRHMFSNNVLNVIRNVHFQDIISALSITCSLVFVWVKGAAEGQKKLAVIIGGLLFFLPNILTSASISIQKDLYWGVGYLPVYISHFGAIICIVSGFLYVAEILKEKRVQKHVFLIVCSLVLFVFVCITAQNNRIVVERFNAFTKYPRELLGMYLNGQGRTDLSPDSIIVMSGTYWFENKYFFYQQTGIKYRVITEKEFMENKEELIKNHKDKIIRLIYDLTADHAGFVKVLKVSQSSNGQIFYKPIFTRYISDGSLIVDWNSGFYQEESGGDDVWRWCSKDGVIIVYNVLQKTKKACICMQPMSGYPEFSKFNIAIGQRITEYLISSKPEAIKLNFELPPGETRIRMHSLAEKVRSNTDRRDLYFRLGNFKLVEEPNAMRKN